MQPGETGKVPVKLNVGTHGGRQNKTIAVYTNAPGESATIQLKVQGEVWVAVEVQPPNVSFGRLTSASAKDPGLMQKVTVINNVEQPLELTEIRSSNPAFKAEASAIEPGKKYEVRVTPAAALQGGNNASVIDMSTGIKEMPRVSVSVNAYVAPEVEVMPATLMLPAEIPAATNRQLFVKNNAKEPLQLSEVQASNPSLKTTLEETQAGTTYKLVVDVPAGYQPAAGGDKISIKTNNPTVPLVTIPITQMKAALPPAQPPAAGPPRPPAQPVTGAVPPGTPAAPAPPAAQTGAVPPPPPVKPPASVPLSPGSHAPAGTQPPPAGEQVPAGAKPPAAAQPPAGTQMNPGTRTGG